MEDYIIEHNGVISVLIALVASFLIPFIIKPIYKLLHSELYLNRKLWRQNEIKRLLIEDRRDDKSKDRLYIVKSKYFIPTRGQKNGETKDLLLIDHMLENYMKKGMREKYRLFVLGGSGMGKSIFTVALVSSYINKYNKKNKPLNLEKIQLFNKKYDESIRNIIKTTNPEETFLILDGLDENYEAMKNKETFLDELSDQVRDFKVVLVTCREQFYDNKDEEPSIIKTHFSSPIDVDWTRFYLSPFSDDEVKNYLENKYKLTPNYTKALNILKKSSNLMSRPLLLSYIDDLLNLYTYDSLSLFIIYKTVIDSWFAREYDVLKSKVLESGHSPEYVANILFSFSKDIAVCIYQEFINSGNLFISNEQYKKLSSNKKYKDVGFQFKERSLLDHDIYGNIKFSHKSFLEFFLAIDAAENPGKNYTEAGFDMTSVFLNDIYSQKKKAKDYPETKKYDLSCINFYRPVAYEFDLIQAREMLHQNPDLFVETSSYSDSIFKSLYFLCLDNTIKLFASWSFPQNKILLNRIYILVNLLIRTYGGFRISTRLRSEYLSALEKIIEMLEKAQEDKNQLRCTPKLLVILTPDILLNDSALEEILSNNRILINGCVSSDIFIIRSINKTLSMIPEYGFLEVLIADCEIDVFCKFIQTLSESLESTSFKKRFNSIIIYCKVGGSLISYCVNKETMALSTLNTIKNMIDAYKYRNYITDIDYKVHDENGTEQIQH